MIIKINKGQYLSDIISEILSNAIYFKTLPNIGATFKELAAKRHSVIVEPNLPVIKGKRTTEILGVYEGVTVDQIIDYLNSKVIYKKLLVTPESFFKVKEAIQYSNMDLYNDFFLLFDECDRTIRDVDYRKSITLPMNDFFQFKNKAFISATALVPSDPRFAEQGFQHITIEPTFNYKKYITLITSNNIHLSLKRVIEQNHSDNFCIFLNSTSLALSLIKKLDILDESQIFCSRESTYKLKSNGFSHAHEHLKDFKKYNIFTSRFYAAVDMFPVKPPTIIMVTDLVNAPFSMIDPISDSIQIVGRFRNGHDKVFHISNTDDTIEPKTKEEVKAYLYGCEESYTQIQALAKSATNSGAADTLKEALKLVTYANYLEPDGNKNHFMFDYAYLEEQTKSYYTLPENLKAAYDSKHFSPTHIQEKFPLKDNGLSSGTPLKQIVNSVIMALDDIYNPVTTFTFNDRNVVLAELTKCFPQLVEAYKVLGPSELQKNGYSYKQIKKAVSLKKEMDGKSNYQFLKSLQDEFQDGDTDSTSNLKTRLARIIVKHRLDLQPEIKLLQEFFILSKRKTIKRDKSGNEIKGYTIVKCRFNRL